MTTITVARQAEIVAAVNAELDRIDTLAEQADFDFAGYSLWETALASLPEYDADASDAAVNAGAPTWDDDADAWSHTFGIAHESDSIVLTDGTVLEVMATESGTGLRARARIVTPEAGQFFGPGY